MAKIVLKNGAILLDAGRVKVAAGGTATEECCCGGGPVGPCGCDAFTISGAFGTWTLTRQNDDCDYYYETDANNYATADGYSSLYVAWQADGCEYSWYGFFCDDGTGTNVAECQMVMRVCGGNVETLDCADYPVTVTGGADCWRGYCSGGGGGGDE